MTNTTDIEKRLAQIEAINLERVFNRPNQVSTAAEDDVAECCDDIRTLLAALRTAEQALPKWVSVKERLPESLTTVLVFDAYEFLDSNRSVLTAKFYKGDNENWNRWVCNEPGRILNSVTHWMPLPEPPKGDLC